MIGFNRALRRLPGNTWNQRWGIWTGMVLSYPDGRVYLRRRRVVQTPWAALYLHDIERPDFDPSPHSHPFAFVSLVVRGGYSEAVYHPSGVTLGPETRSLRMAGRAHTFPRGNGQVHVIRSVLPHTKTLVLAGRRKDSWGFWSEGEGVVHWTTYLERQNREPTGRRIPGRTS